MRSFSAALGTRSTAVLGTTSRAPAERRWRREGRGDGRAASGRGEDRAATAASKRPRASRGRACSDGGEQAVTGELSYGLSHDHRDPVLVAQKVCAGVYKGITNSQLDELAAETAAALTASHPDYASLAARIVVSDLHKNTMKSFSKTSCIHMSTRGLVWCLP